MTLCSRCGNYTRNYDKCGRCRDEEEELRIRKLERKRREREEKSRKARERADELTRSMPYLPSEIYAKKLAAGEISLPNSSKSADPPRSGSSGAVKFIKVIVGFPIVAVFGFCFFSFVMWSMGLGGSSGYICVSLFLSLGLACVFGYRQIFRG